MGIDINAGNFALTIMNRDKKILRQLYLGQDILHKRRKINTRKDKLKSIYDITFSNRALRSLSNIKKLEHNFIRTRLFQISNEIVTLANKFNVTDIVIEDLKFLRTGRKLGNSKGKRINGIINKIPYAKFRNILTIIAIQQKVNIVAVDPYHTSKLCSRCRTLNRINGGNYRLYKCKSCGLKVNRDRNASKNICNFLFGRDTNSAKISSSQIPNRQVPVNAPLLLRDVCIV
jgi:IS605 OrfB family transposase